jgi:23S rRNA pseudoU1915 N3-methylase RlmH
MSKNVQHNICILGAPRSGKTCFLAGLGLLSESTQKNSFQVKGKSGTKTHVWLTELSRTVRAGVWPSSTTGTKIFELDFITNGWKIPFKMIDYAGESLYDTGGDLDQENTVDVGNFLNSCNTIILLLDPKVDVIQSDSTNPDDVNYSTERVSSLLSALLGPSSNDSLAQFDVALVISKADTVDGKLDSDSAKRMIESSLPGFYEKFTSQCKKNRLGHFFISAVGTTRPGDDGHDKPGSDLHPQGYEALFDWIIRGRAEKKWNKRKNKIKWISIGAVIFSFLIFLVANPYYKNKINQINNSNVSLSEKIKIYNFLPYKSKELEQSMDKIVEENLAHFRTEKDSAPTEEDLEIIRSKMATLKSLKNNKYDYEIQEIDKEIIYKQEQILVEKIQFYLNGNNLDEASANIGQYKEKYPIGRLVQKVNELELILTNKNNESALRLIKDVTTTRRSKSSWPSFLEDKANAIETYLNNSQITISLDKRTEIKKAIELARYFATNSEYNLTIKGATGLKKPEDTYLKVQIKAQISTTIQTDVVASRNPSWNKTAHITWRPGDEILVEWWYDGYFGDDIMAQVQTDDFWSLKKLSGPVSLDILKDGSKKIDQSHTIVFELKGSESGGSRLFEPNDWLLVESYIFPGLAWSSYE